METKNAVVIFEDKEIRKTIIDNEIWVSAVDVAIALGYKNPNRDISQLLKRNSDRFKVSSKLSTLCGSGGKQESWVLNYEGVIMLCMISHTEKAIPFQQWAVKELKKIINKVPKDIRLESKRKRIVFTDTLKDHGCTKPHHYINITKNMKGKLNIDKNKSKDDCDLIEVMKIMLAESLSKDKIKLSDANGYYECNDIAVKQSENVELAIKVDKKILGL